MKSPARAPHSGSSRALWLFVFFLSGGVGLAYEVALSRGLLRVLGSTAATTAVVLAAFVGGLGLGARWGGERLERGARPLRLYGLLELGAALWAVLALPLTGWVAEPYATLAAGQPWLGFGLRVLLAAAVVLPVAFLLGATLPALVCHFLREGERAARLTAWLYGVNTVGAVLGCVWAGVEGVRALGVDGVLYMAAALGAVIGVLAWWRGGGGSAPAREGAVPATTPRATLALSCALLCGFLGLGVEVVGFRLLVFFLEGFTATFASMLGIFILGLGAGSLALGPRLVGSLRPARTLGMLLGLFGVSLAVIWLGIVPVLEDAMRAIRQGAYAEVADAEAIRGALARSALLGAALVLLVPAFLLGPTFALCVRLGEQAGLAPGRAVGRVYLANSLGSLLAPLCVGFVLVPFLHVPGAWWWLAFLACGAGGALFLGAPGREGVRRLGLGLGASVALCMAALAAGLLPAAPEALLAHTVVARGAGPREVLAVLTDEVTTASVVGRADGERILYTDDFAAAATGQDYRYMRMLGHLPVLLAHEPRSALVIAFGTGTTAGAVALHPEVQRLDVVEVSRAVLELAPWFEQANRNVLKDPRVRVVRDDGRNALHVSGQSWDVITLEPLMPYSPAGLPFYTREFYELARQRLSEGGVLCQWVPVHAMSPALYAALLRTFYEVFPDGSLWFFEQSSALIGRRGSARPTREALLARAQAASSDLLAAGFERPEALAGAYLAGGREILAAPAPGGGEASWARRPVRDLDPYPEFEPTPRASLLLPYLHQTLEYLATLVDPASVPRQEPFWPPDAESVVREAARAGLLGRMLEARGDFALRVREGQVVLALDSYADALSAYASARRVLRHDRALAARELRTLRSRTGLQVRRLLDAAAQGLAQGRTSEAQEALRLAEVQTRALLPPHVVDADPVASGALEAVRLRLATLLRLGRCDEAARLLESAQVLFLGRAQADAVTQLVDELARLGTSSAGPNWVFEHAAPCRQEGIAPVLSAARLLEEALRPPVQEERLRQAAKRLQAEAEAEGSQAAAAAFVRALAPEGEVGALPTARAYAVLAVLLERLDPTAEELDGLLAQEGVPAAQALIEAGRGRLLSARPTVLDRHLGAPQAVQRVALAQAIGLEGGTALLSRLATLLEDEDVAVRSEASAALFVHAPELAQDYDPRGPQAQRRQVAERVRLRYAQ